MTVQSCPRNSMEVANIELSIIHIAGCVEAFRSMGFVMMLGSWSFDEMKRTVSFFLVTLFLMK